jgi:hypothetical protein
LVYAFWVSVGADKGSFISTLISLIMLTPNEAILPPASNTNPIRINQKNKLGSWLTWAPGMSDVEALLSPSESEMSPTLMSFGGGA